MRESYRQSASLDIFFSRQLRCRAPITARQEIQVSGPIEFTAHNIRLDNGEFTKPDIGCTMEAYPWFVSARKIIETVFPGDKSRFRLIDLGCLEGGYAVEFARMGFQVIGLEARGCNIAACGYVKAHTNLPNLQFVQDDAWSIDRYGEFDVIFCCGLLYHLDRPKEFLNVLSRVSRKLLILQTHFSVGTRSPVIDRLPRALRSVLPSFLRRGETSTGKHGLSSISENESLRGRWYVEFADDKAYGERENAKWSSWDNRRSFWLQKEYLLQALLDAGFDVVMEQFDSMGPNIAEVMTRGYYKTESRGTFVGIKTASFSQPRPRRRS